MKLSKIAMLACAIGSAAAATNGRAGIREDMPFEGSLSGEVRSGALLCGSYDNLKAADRAYNLNPDQLKSLGCVMNGATRAAHCISCDVDDQYAFISIELPKSIGKAWARKADLLKAR